MAARLRKSFAAWPRGKAVPKLEQSFPGPKPGVYVVDKENVKQSNLRLVHLGITMDNPDYFVLEVMNKIFGGGFASRLVTNVRSKKGLAYAVWGGVGAGMDRPGMFQVAMGTRTEGTAAGVDALLEEMDSLRRNPPTTDELQRAKEGLLNSFVFRFDSKAKTLNEQATYAFYGYPPDFLDRYESAIRAVTAADVSRVAGKYVHPDQLAILVVGRMKDFDRDLSAFGPVTKLDITIPGPGALADRKAGEPPAGPAP
jgi:zinc protease